MKVKDVMTRGIEGVQATDTILHASRRMRDLDVGALAVFDGVRISGMITDRDITVRVVGSSLNPATTAVGDVMSREPVTCKEETQLSDAAKIMEEYKIRRLLVKDDQGNISGIITVDDIARRGQEELVSEVIRQVKEHIGPRR